MANSEDIQIVGTGNPVLLLSSGDGAGETWKNQIETLGLSFQVVAASNAGDPTAIEGIVAENKLARMAVVGQAGAAAACAGFAAAHPDKVAVLILVGAADIDAAGLSGAGFPTVFIVGVNDTDCPPSAVHATQAKLPGSFVVEVSDAGNEPYSDQPIVFNDSVLSILQMVGFEPSAPLQHSNDPGYAPPAK